MEEVEDVRNESNAPHVTVKIQLNDELNKDRGPFRSPVNIGFKSGLASKNLELRRPASLIEAKPAFLVGPSTNQSYIRPASAINSRQLFVESFQ